MKKPKLPSFRFLEEGEIVHSGDRIWNFIGNYWQIATVSVGTKFTNNEVYLCTTRPLPKKK